MFIFTNEKINIICIKITDGKHIFKVLIHNSIYIFTRLFSFNRSYFFEFNDCLCKVLIIGKLFYKLQFYHYYGIY